MLYRTIPEYRERVWGSIEYNGTRIGEIYWVFHDDDNHSAPLIDCNTRSTSVAELIADNGLSGNPLYPILIKTLYTDDKLSVQVHPGQDGGDLFKEETWIVLDADADSWMIGGFVNNVAKNQFRQALSDGKPLPLLCRETIQKGDIRHIPPGTVHSLGPGIEVLEIQTNCDVTYRLFDWNRKGENGKARELHIDKGIEAIGWTDNAGFRDAGKNGIIKEEALYDCRYSISNAAEGGRDIYIPSCGIFFLTEGNCLVNDIFADAPACFLADKSGGTILLDGMGYIVTEKEM